MNVIEIIKNSITTGKIYTINEIKNKLLEIGISKEDIVILGQDILVKERGKDKIIAIQREVLYYEMKNYTILKTYYVVKKITYLDIAIGISDINKR